MKLVYITGSSSGLGKALAKDYLRAGNRVIGISRSNNIDHSNYEHIHLDLSKPEEYKSFSFPSFDGIDEILFINNAGSVEPIASCGKMDFMSAVDSYHINVLAPIFFTNLLMEKSNNSSSKFYVLNISSGAARYPVEAWGVYCSTKAALDAFARVVDKELLNSEKNFGIRNIYPGVIDTAMQDRIRSSSKEVFPEVDRFKEYKSSRKLGSPEEVSSKIIRNFNSFFTSDEVILSLH